MATTGRGFRRGNNNNNQHTIGKKKDNPSKNIREELKKKVSEKIKMRNQVKGVFQQEGLNKEGAITKQFTDKKISEEKK